MRRTRLSLRNNRPRSSHKKSHRKLRRSREELTIEKRETELLRTKVRSDTDAKNLAAEPHSFVIRRGKVGRYVRRLEFDIRSIMQPNTATKLKELKRNNLKDFIVNGAVLGVTHLLILTRGERSVTLRIIRSPQGPTLSFKIIRYTLARDIISSQRHPLHFQQQFLTAPLVVMNGFNNPSKKHIQLAQTMFQNMFPSINVDTVKLSHIRRCVMINYDTENDVIDIRHYAIKAVPCGLSKSAKKLVQGKIPDLSKYEDISEYFLNPGQLSESEFEGEQKEVKLPQDLSSRGCIAGQRTNIRLIELGPRLTLSLVKVEEGIDEGEVLYHAYVQKSVTELMELRKSISQKKRAKERQRKQNEHRVIRRLKMLSDRKAAEEEALNEQKQKLINRQKAVTGDDDDGRDERILNRQKLRDGFEAQNEPSEPASKRPRDSRRTDSRTRSTSRQHTYRSD